MLRLSKNGRIHKLSMHMKYQQLICSYQNLLLHRTHWMKKISLDAASGWSLLVWKEKKQWKEYLKYLLQIESGLPLNDFHLERIKPFGVLMRKLTKQPCCVSGQQMSSQCYSICVISCKYMEASLYWLIDSSVCGNGWVTPSFCWTWTHIHSCTAFLSRHT